MRLLSRNAEALFWLARYLERGASLARVIEMQSSFGNHAQADGWTWLLTLHTDEARFREHHEVSTASIINFYVAEKTNPGSLFSSIHWARENARALRPFIPLEMWTQLNAFHGSLAHYGPDELQTSQLPRTCAAIRAGCLAQIGTAECTLFRDEGYQFFKMGLLMERADQTSRLLDVKFAQSTSAARSAEPADDFVFWSTILRTAAAYQVFHRLQPASANPESVARFLILNPSHPRSISFCVREMGDALHVLRSSFQLSAANRCLEACEVLTDGLRLAAKDTGLVERLHTFNDWIQRTLIELTSDIGVAFFRAPPKQPQPEPTPESYTHPEPAARPEPPATQPAKGRSQKQSQTQS